MEPVTHTSVRSFFPSSAILKSPFPILSLQVVSPHAPFPVPRSYFSLSARLSHYLLSFFIPTPHLPFHCRLSLFNLFPFILPHCKVHCLEQGHAKNDEQADAAEVVVKETFFLAIQLISLGPFFVCPHLARFRWLRSWNKETLPTASHTADKFFCSLNKFS